VKARALQTRERTLEGQKPQESSGSHLCPIGRLRVSNSRVEQTLEVEGVSRGLSLSMSLLCFGVGASALVLAHSKGWCCDKTQRLAQRHEGIDGWRQLSPAREGEALKRDNPMSGSGMKQGQEVLGGSKRQEVEKT